MLAFDCFWVHEYFGGVKNVEVFWGRCKCWEKREIGRESERAAVGQKKKRVALRKALFFHNNKKNFQLH